MKMLLLCLGLTCFADLLWASIPQDTSANPTVLLLAKVSKAKSKYWILYHKSDDLFTLEENGYTIIKTKVKMVRNNQFWLDMWQSSLNLAVGYIITKGGQEKTSLTLPNKSKLPQQKLELQYFY